MSFVVSADAVISLLDMISLSTLQTTASFDLETPEEPAANAASSSKSSLRVTQSWQWRGIHCAKSDEVSGIPLSVRSSRCSRGIGAE
jgi:hypothetical protein